MMGLFDKFKNIKNKESKLAGTTVKIKVKKLLGDRVPLTFAEFTATQKKDRSFNLTLVNEENNFIEYMSIIKLQMIEQLLFKLDTMAKNKNEKIELIQNKIKKQEERLKKIKNGMFKETVEENNEQVEKDINIIDEENKLLAYKGLMFVVENEGEGTYEEINLNGERQMSFLYNDGILYPYFHNATKISLYPGIATKKKIFKDEEQQLIEDYREEIGGGKAGLFSNILKITVVILIIGLMAGNYHTWKQSTNFNKFMDKSFIKEAELSAVKCASYLSRISAEEYEMIKKNNEYILNLSLNENPEQAKKGIVETATKIIGLN